MKKYIDLEYDIINNIKNIKNIRCEKKFHIYSVGENKYFLNITKKRIPKKLSSCISLILNKVDIINYQGKYALKHRNLPNISPKKHVCDFVVCFHSTNGI